jgi:hypothetical protein
MFPILPCAYCEARALPPAETLKHPFEHRDPYNPRTAWHNFLGLFRTIDEGNAGCCSSWMPAKPVRAP